MPAHQIHQISDGNSGSPSERDLEALSAALSRVIRVLHFRPNRSAELLALTVMQARCLHAIADREGQHLVDVAVRVGAALPGTSRMVDRLVRLGLVLRRPDPTDRRAILLSLTDRAKASLAEVRAGRLAEIEQATCRLDSPSFARVLASLRLLADAAEQTQTEPDRDVTSMPWS